MLWIHNPFFVSSTSMNTVIMIYMMQTSVNVAVWDGRVVSWWHGGHLERWVEVGSPAVISRLQRLTVV